MRDFYFAIGEDHQAKCHKTRKATTGPACQHHELRRPTARGPVTALTSVDMRGTA